MYTGTKISCRTLQKIFVYRINSSLKSFLHCLRTNETFYIPENIDTLSICSVAHVVRTAVLKFHVDTLRDIQLYTR